MPRLGTRTGHFHRFGRLYAAICIIGAGATGMTAVVNRGMKAQREQEQKEVLRQRQGEINRERSQRIMAENRKLEEAEAVQARQMAEAAEKTAAEAKQKAEDLIKGRLVEAFRKGQSKFVMPSDDPKALDFMSLVAVTDPATGEVYLSAHRVLGLGTNGDVTAMDPVPALKVKLPAPAPK